MAVAHVSQDVWICDEALPTDTPTATDTPTDAPTATDTPADTPTATNTPTSTATATLAGPMELEAPDNMRQLSGSTVAWDEVKGASYYELRWEADGESARVELFPYWHQEYTIPRLSFGVTFEMKVRALGDGETYEEEGPWSAVLELTLEPGMRSQGGRLPPVLESAVGESKLLHLAKSGNPIHHRGPGGCCDLRRASVGNRWRRVRKFGSL